MRARTDARASLLSDLGLVPAEPQAERPRAHGQPHRGPVVGAPGRRHRGAGRRARPSRAERSRRVGESCISARARSRGRPWAVRGRSDAAVHTAARARGRRRGAALRSCARQRALRPAAGPRRLARGGAEHRRSPDRAQGRGRAAQGTLRNHPVPVARGLRGMPAADRRVHAERPAVRAPVGAAADRSAARVADRAWRPVGRTIAVIDEGVELGHPDLDAAPAVLERLDRHARRQPDRQPRHRLRRHRRGAARQRPGRGRRGRRRARHGDRHRDLGGRRHRRGPVLRRRQRRARGAA